MGKLITIQLFPSASNFFTSYCFSCCRNKPYSSFKPGQTTLERDYYAAATHERANGDRCLTNYQRFRTDYKNGVSKAVQPGDYKVPSKDANNRIDYDLMNKPELFGYTRRAKYDPEFTETFMSKTIEEKPSLSRTTTNWKTSMQSTNETQMAAPFSASQRPLWSYNRQAYSSKRGYF